MGKKFLDRHRAPFGFQVAERDGRLHAGPNVVPMRPAVVWIVLIHLLILSIIFCADRAWFVPCLGLAALELPTLLSVLFLTVRGEAAKGPLLEVDGHRGEVSLSRDGVRLRFDEIEAVSLLVGWYEWGDWSEVAETGLVVSDDEGRPVTIPVVLHDDVGSVEDLAGRMARIIGKPVRRSQLGWKDRQRRAVRGR